MQTGGWKTTFGNCYEWFLSNSSDFTGYTLMIFEVLPPACFFPPNHQILISWVVFFGKLTRHLLINSISHFFIESYLYWCPQFADTPIHLGASNGDLRNKKKNLHCVGLMSKGQVCWKSMFGLYH